MSDVTRFAPSPTGRLHLGHAYAALFAARAAGGGRFLLRIEDIDATRCRREFEQAIYDDLSWLGLAWETPVRRQSEHMADYAAALERLKAQGLIYPCFCTRAEIRAEIARAGAAPHAAEGPLYPGTCRRLDATERARRIETGAPYALRLDAAKASAQAGTLTWHDRARGTITADPHTHGDVVLARKETPTSYHLSVTLDDHLQGVSLVT
ncbi:MAG TPA: tRNA glutamyl-Q(34) synthetase GluQRS, partial [Alphaproteobacteria bacterium]|nr:tRNA glutamyl-Q(34) synthetase GluQRS [Alphaproteobacteria bacterium]